MLLIIAITLIVVLTRSKKRTSPSLDDSISQNAVFPNGSYLVSTSSLQSGSPTMAPLQLNLSMLAQFGIRVDNSSLIAETGRLSYFYIWLPPQHPSPIINLSNKKSQMINNTDVGIRFGDADTINVVPLSLALIPRSGFSLVRRMPDLSAIYQLEVRMPDSMCTGQSLEACILTGWQPYSIYNGGTIGEPGSFTNPLPVACGSQCDSPSDSPCATTCQTCDGQQVAGTDTPVTRRYNLGTTKATVSFVYETYSVKDRITVVYQDQIVFDSGCIGTNGERRTNISYSGNSNELRVDVEPNCKGTTGTAWYFTLGCACNGPSYLRCKN